MSALDDFRAKYPGAYDDLSDEELAVAVHKSAYSDMPYEEFAARFAGPQQQPEVGQLASLARGGLVGGTFDFADEVSGLGGMIMGQPYEWGRDAFRAETDIARTSNPKTFLGGEILGSIAVPGAAGAKAVGTGARQIPRLMGAGAAEGGLYGAGKSEADTVGGVAQDAAQGAVMGAVAAPIGAKAVESGLKGGAAVGRQVGRKLFDSPEQVARRSVRGALASDRATPEMVDELLDRPEAMLADLGENTRDLGRLSALHPGEGRTLARENLTGRQYGQQDRMIAAAREEMGGGDYYAYLDDLIAKRSAEAGPKYREAHSMMLGETPELAALSQRPAVQSAMKKASNDMLNEDEAFGVMSTQFWDLTKRNLDDAIDSARRQGANSEARRLTGVKNQLLAEIDAQNPLFREARGIFAGSKELENAAELGKSVFVGQKDARLIRRELQGLTEGELDAFRVGALDSLMTRVKSAGGTHNAVKRLVNSTNARELVEEIFPDVDSAQRFLDRLDVEANMQETFNRAYGGSLTQANQMQERVIQENVGALAGVAGEVASGGTGLATGASQGLRRLFRDTLGEEEYEEVAKLLFGHLPAADRAALFRRALPGTSVVPGAAGRLSTGPVSAGAGGLVAEEE